MHQVPSTYDIATSVHSDRFSVHWETPEARFHVWMAGPGEFKNEPVIYKNPPHGVMHRGEGYFDTRMMDLEKAVWRDVYRWLLSLPEGDFESAQTEAWIKEENKQIQQQKKRVSDDMEKLSELLGLYFPNVTLEDLKKEASI